MKLRVAIRRGLAFYLACAVVFTGIWMGTAPVQAKAEESNKVLITQTMQDLTVVPDKYNTGCKGALQLLVEETDPWGKINWKVGDIILTASGSGDKILRVMDFYYRNKEISGEVVLENIDFSDKALTVYNEGGVERKIRVIFNNCKFLSMSTGKADSNVSYEFNNCSFVRFYGSNATFNRCKFGGSYSDGMNPFRNVEVNDCFWGDMNHAASGGEVHTDGMQVYGHKDIDAENIHFTNCRFELPALNAPGSTAYVNACIMVQLEFSNGKDISFKDCTVNGGGNTVFAHAPKGDFGLENVVFDGLNIGYGYKHGPLDSRISPVVDFKNLQMANDLYVSSVWKDEAGTHLIVTNDTARDRTLRVFTDKGSYAYEIEAFDKTAENAWQVSYNSLPIDKEIVIEEQAEYVVCFSEAFEGCAKQIRFENFGNAADVYLDKAVMDVLTVSENAVMMAGNCGKTTTYTLTYGGLLTISGTGATTNFHSKLFPEWDPYKDCVREVVVEEGIEKIGNSLFARCNSIEKISLPDSLVSIGQYAFDGAVCVNEVVLPPNLKELGTAVFQRAQLKEIYFEGEDWDKLSISKGNDVLNNNAKYYGEDGIKYRVMYYLNDTQEAPARHTNPLTFSLGDTFAFTAPVREGYHFEGWFADAKLTKELKGLNGTETDNVLAYAKWSEKTEEDTEGEPIPPADTPSAGIGTEGVVQPESGQPEAAGVQFKKQTVTLKPGKKVNNIKQVPDHVTVTYKSSNKKAATVDSKGVVKAVNAGKAVITAKAGDVTTSFTVRVSPKKVSGLKLKKKNASAVKISWKRDKKATGYQVMMKTGKKGKYKLIKTVKKNKIVSYSKKNLKKGKTYYIKVRAYKVIDGKKVYGTYSKVKKIKM